MPRDYFDIENEEKEELTDAEKEEKVIEFIAQVTRKLCPAGEYESWLQDGRSFHFHTYHFLGSEILYNSVCPYVAMSVC